MSAPTLLLRNERAISAQSLGLSMRNDDSLDCAWTDNSGQSAGQFRAIARAAGPFEPRVTHG